MADDRRTVRRTDTGAPLESPAMGWTFIYHPGADLSIYGPRLAPTDTLEDAPGLTTIYFRLPWAHLEPTEGDFRWSLIDAPAQRWIDEGKQIALRFFCSGATLQSATPDWVRAAGATGYEFQAHRRTAHFGSDQVCWEPDYEDPVYLEKFEAFLEAAGARYDDNPNVAFVDISFGCWGEGHCHATTKRRYPTEALETHIDLYREHFPNTLLTVNDDFAFWDDALMEHAAAARERGAIDQAIIDYARERDTGFRDDSILVQAGENAYLSADLAQEFWPNRPVVLEHEHFELATERGNWDGGWTYLEAIEAYHASFASINGFPREFLENNPDLVDAITRRLGYRVRPAAVSWTPTAAVDGTLDVRTDWVNGGVAPCYPGGHPAYTLKADSGIVAVLVDESFDVRELPVDAGAEIARGEREPAPGKRTETFTASLPQTLDPGVYDLFVSLGAADGTPRLELPIEGDDGHRRYRLGELEVLT